MLAFCTSPSEIALVLEQSDAKWLSEEMSFLSELYRSKAGSSERQFGGNDNPASASFSETALKCQRCRSRYKRRSVAATAGKTMAPINAPMLRQPVCRIPLWLLPVQQTPPRWQKARPR